MTLKYQRLLIQIFDYLDKKLSGVDELPDQL